MNEFTYLIDWRLKKFKKNIIKMSILSYLSFQSYYKSTEINFFNQFFINYQLVNVYHESYYIGLYWKKCKDK